MNQQLKLRWNPNATVMSRAQLEADRIDELVRKLRAIGDDPVRIRALCYAEIGMVKAARQLGPDGADRPALTTVKGELSHYRSEIARRLGRNHASLTFLRLRDVDLAAIDADYRETLSKRHTARRPLNIGLLTDTARDVLKNADDVAPLELAVALVALTGRRSIEVLQDLNDDGDYSARDGDPDRDLFAGRIPYEARWSIVFAGQRKTKGRAIEPYEIPVLAPPGFILHGLEVLRRRYSLQKLTSAEIGNRTSSKLGMYARGDRAGQRAPGYFDADGAPLNPKDLRAAYATACWSVFAPDRMSPNAYFARILGHAEGDLVTSLSYTGVFYPLREKGAFEKRIAGELLGELQRARRDLKRASEIDRIIVEKKIGILEERLGFTK